MDVACTTGKTHRHCTVKDDDGDFSEWECKKHKNGTWSRVKSQRTRKIPRDLMNCLRANVAKSRAASRKTTGGG